MGILGSLEGDEVVQNVFSLLRVLLLASLIFLSYWGLAVLSFQDFVWQLAVAEHAESGQQVFYILPWLMLAMATLIPLAGMLVAMHRWYMEKAWRKALALVAVLALLGLIALLTSQWADQREISFRLWKPSAPEQAVLAAGEPTKNEAILPSADEAVRLTIDGATEATFQASIEEIKSSLSSEERQAFEEAIDITRLVLEDGARSVLGGKNAQEVITEAQALAGLAEGARYSVAVDRHNEFRSGYLRFYKAMEKLDAELTDLSAVLRERVEAGRLEISDAESVQAKWKEFKALLDDTVKPRYDYFESQVDRLTSINENNLSQNQQWLASYAKEVGNAAVWIERHAEAVEVESVRVRKIINR